MSKIQDLKNAIDNNNITLVRVMLKDSLVIDPTLNEFNELMAYAESHVEGLYEEHDNEVLEVDNSKWNKDYMNTELNNSMYNFSKERVEHLKKVCKYVYSDKTVKNTYSNSSNKTSDQVKVKVVGTKSVAKTAVVGGTCIAAAGIVLGKTIITAGGAAIAIAGVGACLMSNDK